MNKTPIELFFGLWRNVKAERGESSTEWRKERVKWMSILCEMRRWIWSSLNENILLSYLNEASFFIFSEIYQDVRLDLSRWWRRWSLRRRVSKLLPESSLILIVEQTPEWSWHCSRVFNSRRKFYFGFITILFLKVCSYSLIGCKDDYCLFNSGRSNSIKPWSSVHNDVFIRNRRPHNFHRYYVSLTA